MNRAAGLVGLAALTALGACNAKGTLDRSQVEYMTVEGRRYEVRVAPTDIKDEYRMLTVRATLVVDPIPKPNATATGPRRNRSWTAPAERGPTRCWNIASPTTSIFTRASAANDATIQRTGRSGARGTG
jgi:hypothetical protein